MVEPLGKASLKGDLIGYRVAGVRNLASGTGVAYSMTMR